MTAGACPSCAGRGAIGEPCEERGCRRRGYCFVPPEWAGELDPDAAGALDAMVGRRIDDYLVVDTLGAGGFGTVYLALQLPVMLKAALKLMQDRQQEPALAAALLRRFEGEARALARLSHPNVVRLLKYGLWSDAPYMVMEYVDGGRTLAAEVARHAVAGRPLPTTLVAHVLRQVLHGLEAAHRTGIVHRDIKPDNVMLQEVVGDPYHVRLVDFGLAKFVEERSSTSILLGTPMYMAPEQLDRAEVGPHTDLYATGVMAFELLTGRRPFASRTHQEILRQKVDPMYRPTAVLRDLGLPPEVLAFFDRALARHPEGRYRSADEMRDAFEAAVVRGDSTLFPGGGADVSAVAESSELGRQGAARTPGGGVGPAVGIDALGETGVASSTSELLETGVLDGGEPEAPDEVGLDEPDEVELRPWRQRWRWTVGAGVVLAVGLGIALSPGGAKRGPLSALSQRGTRPSVQGTVAPAGDASSVDAELPSTRREPAAPVEWVALDGGSFLMGAADGDSNERPPHEVTLEAFELARTEVTVGQYESCVKSGACGETKAGGACNYGARDRFDDPVTCATWHQAQAFCEWAGGRLPTEAEWEYAARGGGRDVPYPWGSDPPTCARAVMNDGQANGCGRDGTWPVCSLESGRTPQGLCDMAGNVWEWVADWYAPYEAGPATDPKGPPIGYFRVARGGSLGGTAFALRTTARYADSSDASLGDVGFRCARSPR